MQNALVLAAVDEALEPSHLLTMIVEALSFDSSVNTIQADSDSAKYQMIGKYDMTKY